MVKNKIKFLTCMAVLFLAVTGIGVSVLALKGGEQPLRGVYLSLSNHKLIVLDPKTDRVIASKDIGFWSEWPSNQHNGNRYLWYNLGLMYSPGDPNKYPNGYVVVDSRTLEVVANITSGSNQNWVEASPNGDYAVGVAREPMHVFYIMDGKEDSPTFGTILDTVPIPGIPPFFPGQKGPGPCDMSMSSDGKYAWEPDIWGDTITVLDLDARTTSSFKIPPLTSGTRTMPVMDTVSWDNKWLFVENWEFGAPGKQGTESVWNISDPTVPKEVVRFVQDGSPKIGTTLPNGAIVKGGLGEGAMSDEFTKDMKYNFIISTFSDDIRVVDMKTLTIVKTINLPAGSQPTNGDFTKNGKKFYVNAEGIGAVCKIDVPSQTLDGCIPVGPVKSVIVK